MLLSVNKLTIKRGVMMGQNNHNDITNDASVPFYNRLKRSK